MSGGWDGAGSSHLELQGEAKFQIGLQCQFPSRSLHHEMEAQQCIFFPVSYNRLWLPLACQ